MGDAIRRIRRIETWARAGYAARGLVYLIIGALVLLTGRGQSASGAVQLVWELPLGSVLLAGLALGLLGYGLFRLYEALMDLEGRGKGLRGRAARIGRALGGLAYWAVAALAIKTLVEGPSRGADTVAAREMGAQVVAASGGGWPLSLAGLVIIAIAAGQAWRAWACDFWWLVDGGTPRAVRHLGRVGFAARAVVIFLVGWFVLRAGLGGIPLRGASGAIDALRGHPLLLKLVGTGLLLFGIFSLAMAKYRRISDEDAIDRLGSKFGDGAVVALSNRTRND